MNHHDYDYDNDHEGSTSFSGLFSIGRPQIGKHTNRTLLANTYPTLKIGTMGYLFIKWALASLTTLVFCNPVKAQRLA